MNMDLKSVSSLKQLKLIKSQQSKLIIFLSTILTVREICQFLNVLRRTISNMCHKGLLKKDVTAIEKVTKGIDEDEELCV